MSDRDKCKNCIYNDKTSFCGMNKIAYALEDLKAVILAPFGKKPTPHECRWYETIESIRKEATENGKT